MFVFVGVPILACGEPRYLITCNSRLFDLYRIKVHRLTIATSCHSDLEISWQAVVTGVGRRDRVEQSATLVELDLVQSGKELEGIVAPSAVVGVRDRTISRSQVEGEPELGIGDSCARNEIGDLPVLVTVSAGATRRKVHHEHDGERKVAVRLLRRHQSA